MPPLGITLRYALLVVLWSSTWAAIRVGVVAVPPFVFAFERALAVSVLLTAASFALGLRFPRDRRSVVAAAVAGTINTGSSWAIIFWSEQYVPSGLVAVFGAAGPLWTAVLAHYLVQGDRLSPLKLLGLLLGIAGIGVLVGAPEAGAGAEALVATLLLALMAVTWAVGTIVQARLLREGSPVPIVALGTWTGTLVLAPLALAQAAEPQRWTLDVGAAFAYLVVFGSCVGLVLQLWLTRRLRPTTMMLSQLLIAALALVVGAVALGETVTWRTLGGSGLVGLALLLNAVAGTGAPDQTPPSATPAD